MPYKLRTNHSFLNFSIIVVFFQIEIREYSLELWPGYVTSIGQYENDVLLNAEINFKVLRMDTAYQLFRQIAERGRDFKVRR